MAKAKFDWIQYRWDARNGHATPPPPRHICALLDSRDVALKALEAIVAECPRPTKPYGKRIVSIAKEGIKAAG